MFARLRLEIVARVDRPDFAQRTTQFPRFETLDPQQGVERRAKLERKIAVSSLAGSQDRTWHRWNSVYHRQPSSWRAELSTGDVDKELSRDNVDKLHFRRHQEIPASADREIQAGRVVELSGNMESAWRNSCSAKPSVTSRLLSVRLAVEKRVASIHQKKCSILHRDVNWIAAAIMAGSSFACADVKAESRQKAKSPGTYSPFVESGMNFKISANRAASTPKAKTICIRGHYRHGCFDLDR
jgi:hypothetical protein